MQRREEAVGAASSSAFFFLAGGGVGGRLTKELRDGYRINSHSLSLSALSVFD